MSQSVYESTVTETYVTTQGPEINTLAFQGWYLQGNGSWEAITCGNSQSFLTSDGYAQCCDSGATTCTTFWTACSDGNPVGLPSATCGSPLACQTMSIFDQFPSPVNEPNLQILCAVSPWPASSIYRSVIITSLSESIATITPTPSSPISASMPRETGSASSSSAAASSSLSTSGDSTSTNSSSSSSKAWIAGAVIGPLVALALAGFLFWYFRRKRSGVNNNPSGYAPPPAQNSHGGSNGYEYYSNVNEPKPHYAAPQQQNVHEMPYHDPRNAVHELSEAK